MQGAVGPRFGVSNESIVFVNWI